MYTLANDTLEVSILDPLADRERFDTRYCTGGYIFQISDTSHGDLLSGPTYPDDFDWFNGQGRPIPVLAKGLAVAGEGPLPGTQPQREFEPGRPAKTS